MKRLRHMFLVMPRPCRDDLVFSRVCSRQMVRAPLSVRRRSHFRDARQSMILDRHRPGAGVFPRGTFDREDEPWANRILARHRTAYSAPLWHRADDFMRVVTGAFFIAIFAVGEVYLTPDLKTPSEFKMWAQLLIAGLIFLAIRN